MVKGRYEERREFRGIWSTVGKVTGTKYFFRFSGRELTVRSYQFDLEIKKCLRIYGRLPILSRTVCCSEFFVKTEFFNRSQEKRNPTCTP